MPQRETFSYCFIGKTFKNTQNFANIYFANNRSSLFGNIITSFIIRTICPFPVMLIFINIQEMIFQISERSIELMLDLSLVWLVESWDSTYRDINRSIIIKLCRPINLTFHICLIFEDSLGFALASVWIHALIYISVSFYCYRTVLPTKNFPRKTISFSHFSIWSHKTVS